MKLLLEPPPDPPDEDPPFKALISSGDTSLKSIPAWSTILSTKFLSLSLQRVMQTPLFPALAVLPDL